MTPGIMNAVGTALITWLVLWRIFGDRWGWLGMLNAWAEWGLRLLGALGLYAFIKRRSTSGVAFLSASVLCSISSRPTSPRDDSPPADPGRDSRFTVFSANLFKRNPSIASHIAQIRRSDADILCLQEFSPHFASELLAALGSDYPYRQLRPQKGAYGFAVLSRFPIEETGYWERPGVDPWGQRVRVTITGGEEVEIYNVHLFPPMADTAFANGLTWSFRTRERQVGVIQDEIASRQLPAIIIGDHNFSDTSNAYRLAESTWIDSWLEAGRGMRYTWPMLAFPTRWVPVNLPMLRLDYCFHTDRITCHSIQRLTHRTGSDHTPLVATLSLAPAFRRTSAGHSIESGINVQTRTG